MGKKKMKQVSMNPFFKLFKMFLLLGATIIITVSLQGCQKNSVSNAISPDNKSDWTTYTDGNTVVQVLAKGNYLWAVTEGGIVRWNMDTGTYQKYTTADGLINNNVSGMTEDKSGNLWFVTGGVTEYNGKSWHSLPDINNINSLSPIGVTAITFDNKNNLYVGMSDGSIYLFNSKYQEIKSPDETPNNGSLGIHGVLGMEGIKALAVDKNNTLWSFGADGTQRYDGKSWVDSQDIPGFPEGALNFIGKDKNNDLWFQDNTDFSSSYLYRYDGASWQKIDIQFTDSNAQSITIDNQGNVWCATLGTLKRYNGQTWQTFKCPVSSIDSIAADAQGNIWCGAYLNDVLRFDGNSWKPYVINDIPGVNEPTFIAADNNGNTWFSTFYGLSRFDGKKWAMVDKDIAGADCFLEDKQGNLWFGSQNDVYRYDGTSWDIFSTGSYGSRVTSIIEDNSGNIWVNAMNFVYRFDGKSWTSFDVRNILGLPQRNVQINSLTIDNQNTIWAATTNGILHFDGTNWQVFTTADGLADDYIAGLVQDKSGSIWAYGFNSALNLYNGTSWQSFLQGDRIADIAQDENGNMWLATDHGVIKYDGSNFQSFTTADGLLDNSINTVIVDNNNEIWCGTDYGVNCYNGKAWQSITTSNVLAGSQILQIAKGQSDDIWFSSFGGISHYNSAKGSQSAIQIDPTGSTPITENQLTSISITSTPGNTLSIGASLQYIALGTLFDSQSQNITDQVKWTSSDNAVATISTDGLATGIGAGSSLITATLSGITSPAASLTVISASIETSP
jgi:Predicted periplasmic ligand-binding sensor domain